ncbi:hypothetical protein G7062_10395 [Erysipelothrix sp. HDW6C]|uniref:hypothetical protein n=1 Tax=Erysipelothrix sp. HDW6C TaxID=2714930 RepID=UPI001409359F|nr:hypothetical protein [Erysipelothrix sp. HDW6C]QIK70686.1 hypothetical protein G7062_10395 [Erysipelothrix sp. HDW6C]
MNKLIKLEFKRTSISRYTVSVALMTLMLVVMCYFFAFVSKMKPDDAVSNNFLASYEFVFTMVHLLSLASFSILSAVIFSKFVVESYHNENVQLLMLYPVSRIKVFLAKLIVCVSLTIIYAVLSQTVVYLLFFVSESLFPILNQPNSLSVQFMAQFPKVLEVAINATLVGMISMAMGFNLKSIPTTIITAIIISAILCNVQTVGDGSPSIYISLLLMVISVTLSSKMAKKIDKFELRGA